VARSIKIPPHTPNVKFLPAARRWMQDYDYVSELNEADKAWLAQFSDEYYRVDFRYAEPMHATPEAQRERYSFQNASHRDLYNYKAFGGDLAMGDASLPEQRASATDCVPTPPYLKGAEYRAALNEFRRLVDLDDPTPTEERRLAVLQTYLYSIRTAAEPDYENPPEE
jgi:hypothetical protein